MLGAREHNLPGLEHLANGFVGGPDARLLRHVVGEALKCPHRIGLFQAARPTPDSRQQLLLILFSDFRRRPWHGPIFESFDPFGHPALEPVANRLAHFAHNGSNGRSSHSLLSRKPARFERGYAVAHLLSFDTVSLRLPTLLLSAVGSPGALT